jgi:hypothetical protein
MSGARGGIEEPMGRGFDASGKRNASPDQLREQAAAVKVALTTRAEPPSFLGAKLRGGCGTL